jgi:hypothetical protein
MAPKRRPTQTCTICGAPSLPSLIKGQGKCQRHWTEGAWGKAWADKVCPPTKTT